MGIYVAADGQGAEPIREEDGTGPRPKPPASSSSALRANLPEVVVPLPPENDDGVIADEDLRAYRAAITRFRKTGYWYGRWGTCTVCGCVLLPDAAGDRCHEHTSHE